MALGESPQALISSLDASLSFLKHNTLDSIKSSLSSRYVEDFRIYGKSVAYDSLCYRIRVLVASNEYNKSDTLSKKMVDVEQPMSQIEKLQKENQTLRNELNVLKNGTPNEPELTQLQKRSRWIVKKLLIDANAAADSSKVGLVSKNMFGDFPLYYDTIPSLVFEPYGFEIPKEKYLMSKPCQTSKYGLDDVCQRYKFLSKVNAKMMFKLIGRNPSFVDYYHLGNYVDLLSDAVNSTNHVREVEVVDVDYLNIEIRKDRVKKAKSEEWTTNGKFAFQFSQYYVSDNWYKGGEPNATLLGIFQLERNYKEGKKFWNNDANIKLGFYTSQEDTIRAFRVNNDVFKVTSQIGYESFLKKWYYAAYGEFNTQFFRNYKATNSNVIKASFLSPTRIFLSAGAKYEHNSNVWAYLSPLAYKLLFVVGDDIEDPQTVGIEKGKIQNDFGFFGKGLLKWKFTKDISINSSFDIFTPYSLKNVEMNWETVGNFTINKFLSTRLSLNMRFDSTPKSDDYENPKLQIQEQLSLGFNYNF